MKTLEKEFLFTCLSYKKYTFQLLESQSDIKDKPRHDKVNISASKYHEHQGGTRKN